MNRRIVIVVLAVVLAIAGTVAVYGYARSADNRALANTKAADVVVVNKAVPAGTSWSDALKGGYLTQEKVPVDAEPADAVASLAEEIPTGQVATADIQPGQIVLRQMFGTRSAVTGVLAIPKGDIALSVSMTSDADVAGYVQPSSEVAIFHTFKLTGNAAKKLTDNAGALGADDVYASKLLLSRVQVLATSQNAPGDLNGAAGNSSTSSGSVLVTLALTQQQAERVVLAQQTGQLYLGLLSDSSVTGPDGGQLGVATFKPTPIYVN